MSVQNLSNQTIWTSDQASIIEAAITARLLVQAGPGTGKTAVACARVANLIETMHVQAHQILVVSFTNSAIHEFRNRVGSYLKNPEFAASIRLTTIDSFSSSLLHGFTSHDSITYNFDENIKKSGDLLYSNSEVSEYVSNIEHLIVDEAQDITGIRTQLIIDLLCRFNKSAGVSIFFDEAQAIYGFAADEEDNFPGITLPSGLRKYNDELSLRFKNRVLDEIHRTNDSNLKSLFVEGRRALTSLASAEEAYSQTRSLIKNLRHADSEVIDSAMFSDTNIENSLIIFRTRAETLQAANTLALASRRIRLPGMPTPLEPWIARVLHDWDADEDPNWDRDRVQKDEFFRIFSKRVPASEAVPENAWALLLRYAGIDQNQISLRALTAILSRNNPPLDFCMPEFGVSGPIFSTIHRAKGREAEQVYLYLPREMKSVGKTEDEVYEEARVLYVGATRARTKLLVGDGKAMFMRGSTGSGRCFCVTNKQGRMARLEVGRRGDISAQFLVGTNYVREDEKYDNQRFLWKVRNDVVQLNSYLVEAGGTYRYEIKTDGDCIEKPNWRLGWFDSQVNSDMFSIANSFQTGLKAPDYFLKFYSLGSYTMAVDPDSVERRKLREPWRTTGLLLAPLLTGFPVTMFPFRRKK